MQNSIDVKAVLLIFQHVITNGEQQGEKYHYEELFAWTDFDGYTCYLSDGKVTVTVFFHNKYDIDFETEADLSKFEKNIKRFAMKVGS